MKRFRSDDVHMAVRKEYDRQLTEVKARHEVRIDDIEDPLVIHSEVYDRRVKEELSIYDEHLNDYIGEGGWTNINTSHMRLIDAAIDSHAGKRILITFGAGHKYWFLEALGKRDDIKLIPVTPFLPGGDN